LADGVTVMVDVTGEIPVLTAVNPAMLPVPDAASPMLVLEFVQEKVVPEVGLVNAVAVTAVPLQTAKSDGTLTAGVGLTVMVYVEGIPAQLLAVGVTETTALIGAVPVLTAVNAAIFPVPFAAKPIAGFEQVHV